MRETWSMPFRYIVGIISFVLLVAFLIFQRHFIKGIAMSGMK